MMNGMYGEDIVVIDSSMLNDFEKEAREDAKGAEEEAARYTDLAENARHKAAKSFKMADLCKEIPDNFSQLSSHLSAIENIVRNINNQVSALDDLSYGNEEKIYKVKAATFNGLDACKERINGLFGGKVESKSIEPIQIVNNEFDLDDASLSSVQIPQLDEFDLNGEISKKEEKHSFENNTYLKPKLKVVKQEPANLSQAKEDVYSSSNTFDYSQSKENNSKFEDTFFGDNADLNSLKSFLEQSDLNRKLVA